MRHRTLRRLGIPLYVGLAAVLLYGQETMVKVTPDKVRPDQARTCSLQDTGFSIKAGDIVEFSASGTWSWDGGLTSCGPAGENELLGDFAKNGLIGRIGENGPIFFIGPEFRTEAPSEGHIYLGRNSDNCDANASYQGGLDVRIQKVKTVTNGEISLKVRILILLLLIVFVFLITRWLFYEFLIKKNVHPFKAKPLFLSMFLLLIVSAFIFLFYDYLPTYVFILLGVFWLIFFIFSLLKTKDSI